MADNKPSFFDRLKQTAEKAASTAQSAAASAAETAKKTAEKVKINNAISADEAKIKAAYVEIGKKYEEVFAGNYGEEFTELIGQIAELNSSIEVHRAELAALDDAQICPNCGKHVQKGQKFCPSCGAEQPEPEEPAAAEEAAEEAAETAEDVAREVTDAAADVVEEVADAAAEAIAPKEGEE